MQQATIHKVERVGPGWRPQDPVEDPVEIVAARGYRAYLDGQARTPWRTLPDWRKERWRWAAAVLLQDPEASASKIRNRYYTDVYILRWDEASADHRRRWRSAVGMMRFAIMELREASHG